VALFAFAARADSAVDGLLTAGIAEFTAAYDAWDGRRFAAAAELFRQASTNTPPSAESFYWLGTAHFHHLLQIQYEPPSRTSKSATAAAMDAALVAFRQVVQLDPRHAEAHALLGTLYGMKIDGNLVRSAWYGPRIEKHRRVAIKYGTENPRVRYLLGTCQFHTAKKPSTLREALATFLAAEKLFGAEAKESPGSLEPRWGYASCLTFIGRTYELLDQRKEAVGYFKKALAIQPSDHLAREGLVRITRDK